jgi:hypothetical protein
MGGLRPGSAVVSPIHTIGAIILAAGVLYYASSTAKEQHMQKKIDYRKMKQQQEKEP